MAEPYTAYAPHYDRQGLGQWGAALARFALDTLLPRHGARPVSALDLACGTGAVALVLAAAGLPVVGLDRSATMLAVARRRAGAAGVGGRCAFVRADLRAFSFARPFGLITCAYDSLNYLTAPDDLRAAFAQVRAALAPGGIFVCDLTTARAYADEPSDPATLDLGDVAYTWQTAWEPDRQRAVTTLTVATPGGGQISEQHIQRPYAREEVEAALRNAGLRPLAAYAAGTFNRPTLDPPDDATARIVYVAGIG